MLPLNRILVPTDFSIESKAALRAALDLAKTFGSEVTLLHVYEPVMWPTPEGFVVFTPEQMADIFAQHERRLNESKLECEGMGVKTQTALLQGVIAPTIVEHAEQGSFNLIVTGTHGRTGLSHALIGSIAEKIVRTAKCPVLTVRPDTLAS